MRKDTAKVALRFTPCSPRIKILPRSFRALLMNMMAAFSVLYNSAPLSTHQQLFRQFSPYEIVITHFLQKCCYSKCDKCDEFFIGYWYGRFIDFCCLKCYWYWINTTEMTIAIYTSMNYSLLTVSSHNYLWMNFWVLKSYYSWYVSYLRGMGCSFPLTKMPENGQDLVAICHTPKFGKKRSSSFALEINAIDNKS